MTTKRRYIIRETDKRCVINGKQRPRILLLMRRDGLIVAPVSRWLRTVALERDRTLTALTYGDHLRMFWDFLDDTGTDWEHVDDAALLRWRTQQERHRKKVRKRTATPAIRKTTINTRLGTVAAFYRWAECNGYLRPGHVGEVLYKEDGTRRRPRITLVESKRRGRGRGALVPDVLLKGADPKTPRHTPTRTEIDDILREARRDAKTPELADRNVLMIRWASEAACRRMEYASLKVNQVMRFTEHEVQALAATRKEAVIRVLAKRRAAGRDVAVSPDLLQATRELVETSRAAIIGRVKERNGAYRDPGFVFITGGGTALSLKSITNVMGNAFRAAGVEDASGHRLRAHGITEVFEAMYLADRQTATLSPATAWRSGLGIGIRTRSSTTSTTSSGATRPPTSKSPSSSRNAGKRRAFTGPKKRIASRSMLTAVPELTCRSDAIGPLQSLPPGADRRRESMLHAAVETACAVFVSSQRQKEKSGSGEGDSGV